VLQETTRPQAALVRPTTTDIQVVLTVTTHKIQQKAPGKNAVMSGLLSTTDPTTTGTAPLRDNSEDGMQNDNSPPSMTVSDRTLQAEPVDAGGSDIPDEAPSPLTCTLVVDMDASEGKREREQGKEDFVYHSMLDSCDPPPTDDKQIVTPPKNSPKRTKKLKTT
jgi:hypothetical protein